MSGWSAIVDEARSRFAGPGSFPIRAYSEFMPPPRVAIKPYCPDRLGLPAIDADQFAITEYEQVHELDPGLQHIAAHLIDQLTKLAHGGSRELSRKLLEANAAWPAQLASSRPQPREPFVIALPLCLSRTQDDKGRVRWTLFGASHLGPARAFWSSFDARDDRDFAALVGWMLDAPATNVRQLHQAGVSVVPRAADPALPIWDDGPLPAYVHELLFDPSEPIERLRAVLSFEAFARLPTAVQDGFLRGALCIVPWPGSLVFFEHLHYRHLAKTLPDALQVPLLHLFPRSESSYGIRIPQSGWLDEHKPGHPGPTGGHRMARSAPRSHRWQRIERHAPELQDPSFVDHVTTVLFSTHPDDLGLYGKPMARNCQIWSEAYDLVLDGPSADSAQLRMASERVRGGGRFGYRFLFPPMHAGIRCVYWHRPLLARVDPATGSVALPAQPALGVLTAEACGQPPIVLRPKMLARDGHRQAAPLRRVSGHGRHTTCNNVRKILDWSEKLGPLSPSLARRLLNIPKDMDLGGWLTTLPERASDPAAALAICELVRLRIAQGEHEAPAGGQAAPLSRTLEMTRTRQFEERLWTAIGALAHGEYLDKDSADAVDCNEGREGGALGRQLGRKAAQARDNDRLADHLHGRYRDLIESHGLSGKAFVADLAFGWETDFDFSWSRSWSANKQHTLRERNVVVVIPGQDRMQAVVMADHYDTAYMEDLYEPSRGGDRLRASAAGADDNHSATAALFLAADVLLGLSAQGKLTRSVWLVHLTGEEFPADCLGARALAQRLVERSLVLTGERGEPIDLSRASVCGAFVLDMIAHNHDRDRDVFQIAPGAGLDAARLARIAHTANERWNGSVRVWNKDPERKARGRAARVDTPHAPPPIAEHLALAGEIRPDWDPRSSLYNTDGQILSDAGIPVVLFMENYDIRRSGYHDTHDTMKNIDLDYAAALTAIAIESVAEAAMTELGLHHGDTENTEPPSPPYY